ncbi:FtsQ-type POTRA domain-containing protein [Cohnella pontilimi]|uniref:FtsQ-type POTRA domain-containing protein n=1 Tax=Cohnella pontilimi TaxID=2564100 RepID=A0A4V5LSM3_9BACL|nr:FtsQ-type POTRA domain-containing protein [Cohnella pontilimi]TJY43369.1 FtsQ-type POTRA domain-containing protein [Cohnella pontilimi]
MHERIPALKREPETPRRRGGRLLGLVILLFAIVLVVLFFRSSLSKVQEIHVTGIRNLAETEVKAALAAKPGDSFFTPGSEKLAGRVRKLPPVKDVKVIKKFPGSWEVRVTEYHEVASELAADGGIRIVLENGLALPVKPGALPDKPILTGWKPDDAVRKRLCEALGLLPEPLLADLSEIKPDPSKAYPDKIKLFTRSRFEVITTAGKLKEKIPYLSDLVANREPGRIVMLEADTYLPFSAENAPAAP